MSDIIHPITPSTHETQVVRKAWEAPHLISLQAVTDAGDKLNAVTEQPTQKISWDVELQNAGPGLTTKGPLSS